MLWIIANDGHEGLGVKMELRRKGINQPSYLFYSFLPVSFELLTGYCSEHMTD